VGTRVGALTITLVLLALGALLGSAISQHMGTTSGTAEWTPTPRARADRVRVEVLNGGGLPGAARSATDELRDGGFDVVYYGNARDFDSDTSMVLDRAGRPGLAREVADALGISRVASQPDSNLYLDVTVVLGEDWSPSPRVRVGSTAPLPWWSPRRWLGENRQPQPSGPIADPGSQDG
jgi:hypothetical protein